VTKNKKLGLRENLTPIDFDGVTDNVMDYIYKKY
jgi:hypothetical protein